MFLGFTGTSDLPEASHHRMASALESLVKDHSPEAVVTGGCVGVDSYVHHWFRKNHPDILRVVVLPGDLKAVDLSVCDSASGGVIEMPSSGKGSTYRDRNEELVRRSRLMASFWTGQERSGTYMTMNIAFRAGKLPISGETIFGVGLSDPEVRNRYRLLKGVMSA